MSAHITTDSVEVRTGQIWRDLDKRMKGRLCRVGKVANGKAEMFTLAGLISGKRTFVSVRRMHKTSTGWELVQDVDRSAANGAPGLNGGNDE